MAGRAGGGRRPRAVFMAFGTQGDVFPIAALAAAFARGQQEYAVVFITHSAHRSLSAHLAASNVRYMPVSSPPVLAAEQVENISSDSIQSNHERESFSMRKKAIQMEHRKECVSSIEEVFGNNPSISGDFIVINFFALEGWHLAELFQVKCVIAAPYFVPYSAPTSFERQFKQNFPLLYKYFQEAPANTVCWTDIIDWMWALFTESWGSWRNDCLNLSPIPFTDPVTNLPLWHVREESPLLLYGFSKEIVECPGYWPFNAHACGFWFLPMAWQFSCDKCMELSGNTNSSSGGMLCANHFSLEHFLTRNAYSSRPIFVGLSSIGRSIPYSWLFPRCAAAIHHAGSGSTAAALLAGIPQVTCPFLLDQFYWAERLHWLGVAPEPLQRQNLVPDNDDALSIHNAADVLVGAIRSALSPEIKTQAARIADRLSFEDGIGEALRILKERVLTQNKT
ncbi:sterol 3-beta-glucosyltransferase UGT80B1-like isoform X3 [Miscanthus floridulus]|uniref:sterol 3-beta-glucosyltransferase UGT80B1-like isoform X3 n=1 Tax=Miscanthus floridulus TaxID=154761 RepID=UPI003457D7F3